MATAVQLVLVVRLRRGGAITWGFDVMKKIAIMVALLSVFATIITVLLLRPSENVASREIYVFPPAQRDFLVMIRSDQKYSRLSVSPSGHDGRFRIRATGATEVVAKSNLDDAMHSLVRWGFEWNIKKIPKEKLVYLDVASAVEEGDVHEQHGLIWGVCERICRVFRDHAAP